jgi:hypothetical protein
MLNNYIKIALKVLARRKFFTFISLFGISFTLLVLMVATAIIDNVFAPRAPESKFDRVLGVYRIGLHGPNFNSTGNPGYRFIKEYVLDLPGAEATSVFTSRRRSDVSRESKIERTCAARTVRTGASSTSTSGGGPFSEDDNTNANRRGDHR